MKVELELRVTVQTNQGFIKVGAVAQDIAVGKTIIEEKKEKGKVAITETSQIDYPELIKNVNEGFNTLRKIVFTEAKKAILKARKEITSG